MDEYNKNVKVAEKYKKIKDDLQKLEEIVHQRIHKCNQDSLFLKQLLDTSLESYYKTIKNIEYDHILFS